MAAQSQNIKLIHKTLRHMVAMHEGNQHGGMLLAGDPGIGKTTFVNILGSLLGMKVVTIEVPHITEEHLINIPFVVFNPNTNQASSMHSQVKSNEEYEMVLADSNLYTQITTGQAMNDQQYIDHIQKSPAAVQAAFKALGGSLTNIPAEIKEVREKYKVVLFLDEFYRATSMRIRNIMRGMLNGNIGKHKIPSNVYTIYASNMRDTGIDETPQNAQFNMVNYKAPSAKDWFDWLIAQYQKDSDIQLNETVMTKFKQLLKDEHISYTDAAASVRTSPRRWEQLLTYINASIPTKDISEARALITNVRNNFIHYQTGEYSDLADKVENAVIDLIKETSNLTLTRSDELEPQEWREALNQALDAQIKTGGKRKHVPVLSGPPGIGKTNFAQQVALRRNLRLIEIDVGELYADDAIGMPIPGNRSGKDITVKFTVPKLFQKINQLIVEADKHYLEQLNSLPKEEAQTEAAKYAKQKFKYLIFFDELNRVDEKTFNAMRRVILEKNFGPSGKSDGSNLELPKEALVVGAINPEGTGVTELTEHFRDVIDVIPAHGGWTLLKKYLMAKKYKKYPEDMKTTAWSIIDLFSNKFKTQRRNVKAEQQRFYLDIGGSEVYVPPREYTDMFNTLIREIGSTIEQALADPGIKEEQIRPLVDEAAADAMEDSLNFPMKKAGVEPDEFMSTLHNWIANLPDSVYGGMLSKKASSTTSLSSSLSKYIDGEELEKMPEDMHIVNTNNLSNDAQIIDEIKAVMAAKIVDDDTVQKYLLDMSHPQVDLKGDELVIGGDPVSLVENMFRALLYTLHIHQFSHSRVNAIQKGLSTAMSNLRKNLVKEQRLSSDVAMEASTAVAELRAVLLDISEGL